MLDIAIKYETELRNLLMNTWYDEKYKYFHLGYNELPRFGNSDTYERWFVSLNSSGEVIGYISYTIDVINDMVNTLLAINFTDDKITFGRDLAKVIDDIFMKFNFRKIVFSVVVGNPAERSYDKLIKKYNGHIIGIYKDHYKLQDHKYYDCKDYEIMRDDYINTKI